MIALSSDEIFDGSANIAYLVEFILIYAKKTVKKLPCVLCMQWSTPAAVRLWL